MITREKTKSSRNLNENFSAGTDANYPSRVVCAGGRVREYRIND